VPTPTVMRPAQRPPEPAVAPLDEKGAQAVLRYAKRVRRLKAHSAAWALGVTIVTAAWVAHEWNANGAFERFAHEGNRGDWNPTLWALVVLLWSLAVGIMALRVHFERPPVPGGDEASSSLEHRARLKFHAAAWLLGMVLLAPLNALIEWQDNGAFERISSNSQPGSWDPWILYAGGIWAIAIATFIALPLYLERRKTEG
jgi:hypothetical protein